jgi:hypothetical protein
VKHVRRKDPLAGIAPHRRWAINWPQQ